MVRELKRRAKENDWPEVVYHQWLYYVGAWEHHGKVVRGSGHCEPEGYIEFPGFVLLFEAKLTGTDLGKFQMEWLYKPLLAALLGKPVRCLHICKWPTTSDPGPHVGGPEEFLFSGLTYGTWNYLGD